MGVSSFHARSGSGSGSTAQFDTGDVHVCHICLKQFSRRDLRERHRRRCEKSIGKIIPTKKRSCERCISFKVKCDYEKPSCSRCLNRSVPYEYRLEPRVKVPLNPAFSLGPSNAAFSSSLDVFSLQHGLKSGSSHGSGRGSGSGSGHEAMLDPQQQHHHHHQQQHHHHHHHHQGSVLTAPEMVFDLSSSSTASTDTCSLAATLDLAGQGFWTGTQDYHQHWSQDTHASQWDATTLWSDASSSLVNPVMLDGAVADSTWATNLLDPAMCMGAYDQSCVLFRQDFEQPVMPHHARSARHFGKSASLSY